MSSWLKKLHQHLIKPITRLGKWQSALVVISVVVALASLPGLFQSVSDYFVPITELSDRATLARQSGDDQTAIRLYQIISDRASKSDYSSNYELGNLYMQSGNYRSAERYYLKAANNPAALMGVFYQLADIYTNHLTSGRDKFAKLTTYRLSTDRKTDTGLMIVLASFYRDWGKLEPALNWFKRAAALDPSNQTLVTEIKSLESSL